ncbi:hypothetical protein [Pseudomonas beijingensis]|uniref:hypothetical protein n=1 Tax=Pseudomonas beijingensis TaxID=2954101 RepID=UPI0027340E79|nr:hypothetical protein [Pseudomonas sp. FP2262]WLH49240.1 hypothetical protein PSH83_10955 [Pseudomonas sp. FP2262]
MKAWLSSQFNGSSNRNGSILDVATDPSTLNPSNLNLGGTGGGHGLLQSGAGYAATMLERYVNRDGIEFVSPSNMVTGGTRPGNGSVNDGAAQIKRPITSDIHQWPWGCAAYNVGAALSDFRLAQRPL